MCIRDSIEVVTVCRNKRRAFRNAVAVYQIDSDVIKELADFGTNGSAAAYDLDVYKRQEQMK